MRSVRSYYREVSRGQLDIVLAGEATVTLPSAWGEYTQRDFTDPRYWPRDILMADAMRLAQGAIDFSLADIAVFVIASPNWGQPRWGGLPPQFIWPSAAGGTYLLGPRSGSWWWKSLPWTVMPAEWENVDPRRVYATLSHEIGHTIGLADLYHDSRAVGGWDLMSSDGGLPALSVPHRQFLGWIDPGWMRIYNFLVQNTVDEEVVLCAAELLSGGPPSGQHGGIVVEVAEGWRYYFEYRSRQNIEAGVDPGPPQVADQNPPSDRRVVGLDVLAKWYKPPLVRDPIRLLGDDGDFEGAALAPGQDYEELDASANSTFRLEVLSADDDQARVRVRYQPVPAPLPPWPNGPDPSIRPWPGGGNWSSPDIWIENALRINIPWANHTNTIFARVTNSGSMDAVGVRVGFWVKDMTVSDAGPETFLGWVTRDIRANASEEFIMAWMPPGQAVPGGIASAHFCLLVRIAQHSQGSPPRAEVNPNNNEAQSNYTMMWTVGSSPFSRERLPVTVANPYSDRAVEVRLHAEQTLDWFRTYLSHKSIWLSPGETREVEVMVECIAGEPAYGDKVPRNVLYVKPNIVAVIAAVVDSNSDVTTPIGGATIEVRAARAAEFTEVDANETGASGRIRLAADGSAPPLGGDVIVGTRATARGGEITYRTKLDPNGRFSVATPGLHALPGTEDLDFVYLGSGEVGPATAQVTFVSR